MNSTSFYMDIENNHEMGLYPKRDCVLVRGKGAVVFDDRGKVYIDCTSGHGVASIGHCSDEVIEAVISQAQRLITCSNTFYNDARSLLVEKLVRIAPAGLNRVFLCNSGAEAVEAAIKFARLTTGKTDFLCAAKSFHGRTLGALSATFNPKYREGFAPLVPGFHFVPYNKFIPLKTAVEEMQDRLAGIILEPVQGEGGVYPGDPEYFRQVRELCDEKGILLIIDEVQTGFCRTGRMFAVEHSGISPDILCLAKAMAGGLPVGAVLCSDQIRVSVGKHGTTFGGNPLVCAAASASIDFMIKSKLAEQSAEKGIYVLDRLKKIKSSKIRGIRGLGLMIGIELKEKVNPLISALMERGILVLPAGSTVLRLLPPLTIEYRQLDVVIAHISNLLS